jgi:hypothetical protein
MHGGLLDLIEGCIDHIGSGIGKSLGGYGKVCVLGYGEMLPEFCGSAKGLLNEKFPCGLQIRLNFEPLHQPPTQPTD